MLKLAVIGKPVAHSRSPQIHLAAMKELGISGYYLRLAVDSGKQALLTAREMGLRGFNVTSPFKEEIFQLVDIASEEARAVKAVNTVIFENDTVKGFNTDVSGVSDALREAVGMCKGKAALILGAGGAARAAIFALQQQGAVVTIANRTALKREQLAAEFHCKAVPLEGTRFERALNEATLVVNALATVDDVVPTQALSSRHVVLESNYAKVSAFAAHAKERGATVIPALKWLSFQGIAAFKLFSGKECPEKIMAAALQTPTKNKSFERFSLIGMMGAGKSAVGKKLADAAGLELVDLDQHISKIVGQTIPALFKEKGELAFREIESAALEEVLTKKKAVISCGGGAIVTAKNRTHLQQSTQCVWLWADPRMLAKRVGHDAKRPLLQGEDPEKKLSEILSSRWAWYADACELVVPTDEDPTKIAARILYETNYTRPC